MNLHIAFQTLAHNTNVLLVGLPLLNPIKCLIYKHLTPPKIFFLKHFPPPPPPPEIHRNSLIISQLQAFGGVIHSLPISWHSYTVFVRTTIFSRLIRFSRLILLILKILLKSGFRQYSISQILKIKIKIGGSRKSLSQSRHY